MLAHSRRCVLGVVEAAPASSCHAHDAVAGSSLCACCCLAVPVGRLDFKQLLICVV
jgi:hypothetical protein